MKRLTFLTVIALLLCTRSALAEEVTLRLFYGSMLSGEVLPCG